MLPAPIVALGELAGNLGDHLKARTVADRLYGGGGEHRLQQEMLLGIGGVRAIRVWNRISGTPAPDVHHTNEGHAGFLGLERIRELVGEAGLTVEEADVQTAPLVHAETHQGGRHRYQGSRVLPRADHLADPAELGLVVNA